VAHMHYKGTGKIHSFRGTLGLYDGTDAAQQEINIEGSVGAIAWRITKFQILPQDPITADIEAIMKIFREPPTTSVNTVNFDDDNLLAAAVFWGTAAGAANPVDMVVIFDNTLFVRNIHLQSIYSGGNFSVNYYIELEEVTISTAGKAQLALAAARRTGDR
jgi:hypothetical protein